VFEGFTLRGRTRRHLYLENYYVPWLKLPEVLLHLKRGVFEYGLWRLSIPYGLLYVTEHAKWNTDYMPPGGLKGKRILDVGAGCGESAMWFLKEGARQVLCVENNQECRSYLERNARLNKGVSVLMGAFNPGEHLWYHIDLVKMDIEGYEVLFADYLDDHPEFNVDCVVEVHSVYQKDRFLKLGFSERVDPIFGGDPPWGLWSSARLMYRWKK
jgi:hypothetical protein